EVVRDLAGPLAVSDVARVEIPSALWRKHRRGEVDGDDLRELIARFEADWDGDRASEPAFTPISVSPVLLGSATRQVGRHGLRALDGIQLATALLAAQHLGSVQFACFDDQLRLAAQREGLTLIP
ncbi:MAG: type II toxin-antitoxin system VapC family toxin, partial [Ilumatobacteraceae bacterium]